MDLPGSITKLLKPHGFKTIGDLLAATPTELAGLGLSKQALREVATAASEMTIPWQHAGAIDTAPAEDEPVRPALRKYLLAQERSTFVLEGFVSPRSPTTLACPNCPATLVEVARIDLSAFPSAGLPDRSVLVARCDSEPCKSMYEKSASVTLGPAGEGARPAYRREYDYPVPDAKKSSDSHDSAFFDHQHDVIGTHNPRVGGYADWGNPTADYSQVCDCGENMVLAFECANAELEEHEHALVCPSGCRQGRFIITLL